MTDVREYVLEVWKDEFIVGAFDKHEKRYLSWDETVELLNLTLKVDE